MFAHRLAVERVRSAPMSGGGGVSGRSSSVGGISDIYSYGSWNPLEKDYCDVDLNDRLESLCLSMTEHALAGANDI